MSPQDLPRITTDVTAPSRPVASSNPSSSSSSSSSSANSAQPLRDYMSPPHAHPPSAHPPLVQRHASPTHRAVGRPARSPLENTPANGTVAPSASWLYDPSAEPEDDDWLHVDGVERPRSVLSHLCCFHVSLRGLLNMAALTLLTGSLLMLFAGYPILSVLFLQNRDLKSPAYFGLGGTNGSGQVPALPLFSLVDPDTPAHAQSWSNPLDASTYHLVFSDEFDTDGRTFNAGDDPFWQAVDLHYWVTGDYEWYSPAAVNTSDGFLNIHLTQKDTHNLNFQSGMLQSWNKFCFQGGYIEASVILPGAHDTQGYWPAVWLLGNLGRAGYAGTTEGMWPYSYSSCDIGTLPNQTWANGTGPDAALHAYGLYDRGESISYLSGQRASACTCAGEDHPGPSPNVGRSAPEIDMFETQAQRGHGVASQSLQIAPFDANYTWTQAAAVLHAGAGFNSYTGGRYQEAVSALTRVPDTAYALSGGVPTKIGVQYDPDWTADGSGSITWFVDGQPAWTLNGDALAPNEATQIGQRLVPTEPMSIVINLALSNGFQQVMWNQLLWPAVMQLDYIRVYQRDGQQDRISCDPDDHPTAEYIARHMDVYQDMNTTIWPRDRYPWPKNSLVDQC